MKKQLCTAFLSLGLTATLLAQTPSPQDGFRITGQIHGVKDTTLVLAQFFGATQYVPKDTARTDAQGRFVFEGSKALPQGLYLIVPPNQRYLELIMPAEQRFSLETDTAKSVVNMKITNSPENAEFYAYQQQLAKFYEEAQAIETQKKKHPEQLSAAQASKQLADLQQKAQTFRKTFLAAHTGTFASKLLKAADEPEVPPAPKAANGRPDSNFVFNYYKAHFWDGFDFSDERLVRTPVFQRKLERYVKELTVQQVDSLTKEGDYLVAKAKANKEVLSYTVWYLTSQYERPKVMGTDGMFVHMAEKYYLTGVMPVSDSSTVRNIRTRVNIVKPLLVGKVLPVPSVSDTLRRAINLAALKANYTVMFFYDPECGHCREATPKLKKFADANKGQGIEFVAIAVAKSPEEWKKYIREFKVNSWINGYDYSSRTDYRQQYDVLTTPTIYVLDKSRKIIARNLPAEQVEDFIQFYQRQQAAKAPAAPKAADKGIKASVKGK